MRDPYPPARPSNPFRPRARVPKQATWCVPLFLGGISLRTNHTEIQRQKCFDVAPHEDHRYVNFALPGSLATRIAYVSHRWLNCKATANVLFVCVLNRNLEKEDPRHLGNPKLVAGVILFRGKILNCQ